MYTLLVVLTLCGPALPFLRAISQHPQVPLPIFPAPRTERHLQPLALWGGPLFVAEQANDCAAARRLLLAGTDPYASVVDTDEVIDFAATEAHVAFVKVLLAYMPKLPRQKAHEYLLRAKNDALDEAVADGTLRQVNDLIATGANINNLDGNDLAGGGSPLMRATDRGSLPLMRYLVAHGARVDDQDDYGRTALMYTGDTDMYYNVVMHDAYDTRDTQAATPLNAGPTRLLLRHGARVDLHDKAGETALMYAAQGNPGATGLLLRHRAAVNQRDNAGRTALLRAAADRDAPSLALLLAHGARVNAQDKEGETALMLASVMPEMHAPTDLAARTAALRVLREYGADPRLKDARGKTSKDYAQMNDDDFVTAS